MIDRTYLTSFDVRFAGWTEYFKIKRFVGDSKTWGSAEFAYTPTMENPIPDENLALPIYTKVITVAPKYILFNKLPSVLMITQAECIASPQRLEPQEGIPFHWAERDRPKEITVRSIDLPGERKLMSGSQWDWSNAFPIDEVGTINIVTPHMIHNFRFMIIKVERKIHDGTIYIIFEAIGDHPLYRIENYSTYFSFKLYQKGHYDQPLYLDLKSKMDYAWPNYHSPKRLRVLYIYIYYIYIYRWKYFMGR